MRKVRRLVMAVNGVRWFGRPSEKRGVCFQTAFHLFVRPVRNFGACFSRPV
ncbi:hypothetical protein NEIELOOT_02819 [Neisseria elongata subsp. glycolytica ATCC 29315]|uniref:Uncharacterized protein n=1 Tax=Neisseria elongata subsp. glycolytica ATCC 29315 TaxID=546263 RepID=D4DUM5_NEIEG|nr:hypothetical protein NEIELOOT_02819 [Neisseria elongata subsp. glycolytica ATCC 29315]